MPRLVSLEKMRNIGIIAHIDAVKPALLIIDSVQTIGSSAADGSPGGVTQVREVAGALIRICKDRDITLLLVGHF